MTGAEQAPPLASTDDNRFRALGTRTGNQLQVTKLERRGNADPITYRPVQKPEAVA
jgi:hypothetical protein